MRVGYWEWRDGSTVAYTPNAFVTSNNATLFDPEAPSPRHSSASWITKNGTVYLFGGIGAPSYSSPDRTSAVPPQNEFDGLHNDMWRYSFRRQAWRLIGSYETLDTNLPGRYPFSRREEESISQDYSRADGLGASESGVRSKHSKKKSSKKTLGHLFDGNKQFKGDGEGNHWIGETKRAPSFDVWPGARLNAATWVSPVDNTLWLFGGLGYGSDNSSYGYLNDLWQYDVDRRLWAFRGGSPSLGVPDSKHWPGARSGAVTWVTPGTLWLFSGYGPLQARSGAISERVRNDIWRYEIATSKWTLIAGNSNHSTSAQTNNYFMMPRTDAIAWTDNSENLVWVFGGFGTLTLDPAGPSGYLNDLWAWNSTSLTWATISPVNSLNTPGFIAERSGVPSPNNRPPSRCCAAAWTDSYGRLYFFGGYGMSSIPNQPSSTPDFVGDMWVLETAAYYRDRAWTWVSGGISKPPPAVVWAGPVVPEGANPFHPNSTFNASSSSSSSSSSSHDPDDFKEIMTPREEKGGDFYDQYPSSRGARSEEKHPLLERVNMTSPAPYRRRFTGSNWSQTQRTSLQRMKNYNKRAETPASPSEEDAPYNLEPSSSPPNPLVSPGSRAWMNCFYHPQFNEAFIFGSLGVNPRASSGSSLPAYFQDMWAFVLPDRPIPQLVVKKPKSSVMIIIWTVVGAEAFLVFAILAFALLRRRRRSGKHGESDSTTEEMSSANTSEMALLAGYPYLDGTANGIDENAYGFAYVDENGLLRQRGSPNSSHPAGYTSLSNRSGTNGHHGSGGGAVGADSPSRRRGRTPSRSGSSKSRYSFTNSSATSYESEGKGKKKRSQSLGLSSNGSKVSGNSKFVPVTIGKVTQLTASFDLVIKRSELEFGSIIGRGSSGTIYTGRWHDQRVAIKQLETDALIGGREGALEEAKLVSLIRPHPNVIQIFGVCVTKVHVFIVMSKMHSSLDKLIYHVQRRKWLTPSRMYKMAMGIVAGMLHLESQGICHRDLAARNVCLSKVGNPCITDFGMSRKLNFQSSNVGETQTQMGPVAWMAPECFLQKYSSKSDVWSFGVVLYEMISGTVPHRGADLHQLAVIIRDQGVTPGPIPPNADPRLIEIMQSCWAYDPAERPSFAQISKRLHEMCNSDDSEDEDSGQSKGSNPTNLKTKKLNGAIVANPNTPPNSKTKHNHAHPANNQPSQASFEIGRSNRTSIDTSRYPSAPIMPPSRLKPRKDDASTNHRNQSSSITSTNNNGSGISGTNQIQSSSSATKKPESSSTQPSSSRSAHQASNKQNNDSGINGDAAQQMGGSSHDSFSSSSPEISPSTDESSGTRPGTSIPPATNSKPPRMDNGASNNLSSPSSSVALSKIPTSPIPPLAPGHGDYVSRF